MHIRVVVPVTASALLTRVEHEVARHVTPEVRIDVVAIDEGPLSIESEHDEALSLPGVLRSVIAATRDDVDAVFVTCFGDPAVAAARECVDIPVVGGFEPAVLVALGLADRFGIVSVLPDVQPMLRGLVRRHGFGDRFVGVRAIDVPVLDLGGHQALVDRLFEQAVRLVREDGAEAIVLGCTGMLGVAVALRDRMAVAGLYAPVVDPTTTALAWLRMQHDLGLHASRITYTRRPSAI